MSAKIPPMIPAPISRFRIRCVFALRSDGGTQLAGCVSDPLAGGIAGSTDPIVVREAFGGHCEGAGCKLERVAEALGSLLDRWTRGIACPFCDRNRMLRKITDSVGRAIADLGNVVERGGSGTSKSHAAEPPCSATEFG